MTAAMRGLVVAALIVVCVVLQVSMFDHLAIDGVAPDLALILVVCAALVRGPSYGALVGFAAGLVLDLAPPADHTAGRWALALVVVGYLIGLARPESGRPLLSTLLLVAAGSFIGNSVFALSGIVLGEQSVTVASAFRVLPIAIGYDVLLTPIVVPLLLAALRRLRPAERWATT